MSNVSDFTLVFYFDKNNNELQHVEYYKDDCSGDIETDINSYKYGYDAVVIRPEELIPNIKQEGKR